ncbi:hypothetical protein GV054_11210 [Marinomonas mediterranea]|jgi:hypothetical protein|uniref:Uncharacterized protein n=1 Tax=Marinomonas mediterranea (strain ATCC 700492 / JCM 21426 / NBRC 103028 / MMB-1) TaxID=717774 RepID=F2JTH9_MARM1|nr:DUF6586 family protein [Marinomonas mediterranea]ADZ91493.1 hypothetical protein Marme_2252 [Marinomonas mediterranea MMB-1]WCN13536.1 hypothetical protein GV054_11210 [Marinomonas mediterranea]WCN17602.1 hypothetical protein GV053_11320 [Marinomonas mediterranea MMB-1]
MSPLNPASLTNQRLDSARRLISEIKSSDGDWFTQGHEPTVTFLLRSALNGLLQEVKIAYGLTADLTVEQLITNATDNELTVPVLSELKLLSADSNSWFSMLLASFDTYFECRPNPISSQLSDVQMIGASASDLGGSVKSYLDSLVELVLRFREESSEY